MRTESKEIPSKRQNQCKICNKIILGGTYKYRSHLYGHKAIDPLYSCSYCLKTFYRRDAFKKHEATHTGIRQVYTCDYCNRSFVDKRNLILHIMRIHDDLYDKQQYSCMACGTAYCEERLLKYHIRKQHFNLQYKESDHITKKVNETWVERVMESKVYVEMTKLDNNVINIKKSDVQIKKEDENGGRSEFQSYVSSVFAFKETSQYSKAICDYCNKEMLKKSLRMHIRERHLKLRQFKCIECGATFKRNYQMVNHICGRLRMRKNS